MSQDNSEFDDIIPLLRILKEKYKGIGQDFGDYLQGLIEADGLQYWDYIHVDALLGLQMPRTPYTDEIIFITYHQICELYFKLIKLEITQLTDPKNEEYNNAEKWVKRISRVVNYFKHLCNSFDIMKNGMDRHDFKAFRMALLPASGFQAAQFRHIEIMSTNINALLIPESKGKRDIPLERLYEDIYWKRGALDAKTKEKVLTLVEFEKKYDNEFLTLIKEYKHKNIAYLFYNAKPEIKENEQVKELLRTYDRYINVFWKMSHLMASSRHLPNTEGGSGGDTGTGGTDWREYLPPRFQKLFFYETLWTEEEKRDWGKSAIMAAFRERVEANWSTIKEKKD